MNPVELQPHELMQLVADFFETHGIHYHVVGSMASMAYGEPRFTNHVDIVAELTLESLPQLYAAFVAADYYIPHMAARDVVNRCSQFSIIHPASGLKVDVIVPPRTEFGQSEKARVRRITSEREYSVWFASPDDVLLNKLVYYQVSGGVSQNHMRDIAGMMKLQGDKLDRSYISDWATKLGVVAEWQSICERLTDRSR